MKEKILSILQRINPDIKDGVRLIDEGFLDSFSVVSVMMEIEDELGVEIDSSDYNADNFQTIDALTALIEKYAAEK